MKSKHEYGEVFFEKIWTQEDGSIYVIAISGDEADTIKKAILLAKKTVW